MSNPVPNYDPRRATMYNRQPEELHIPSGGASLQRQSMSHEFATGADNHVPSINFHPTNAQPNQFGAAANAGGALPGALQPGNVNRPPAMSINTAPSVLPTLPQLSTQQQQQQQPPPPQPQQPPPTTPRSGMANSHSHSRSSPAGVEQSKYKPHGLSETTRYGSSPGAAFPPVTPQGAKYSPLGLSDIRPSADLLNDQLMSPGSLPNNGDNQVPTNSNYIAPWPIYAVDWCKWPITGSSSSFGGKMALGSYLEDNHNYVRLTSVFFLELVRRPLC